MSSSRASNALLHPAILASIALLILNDHWLKWRWPGWVTGKLSDAAGLAFFPLLLAVAAAPLVPARWRETRRLVAVCAVATVAVFAVVKCVPAATEAYRVGLGWLQWPSQAAGALLRGHAPGPPLRVMAVTDPGDLLALPFVAVSIVVARRHWPRPSAG
jgi:hypothetical protein